MALPRRLARMVSRRNRNGCSFESGELLRKKKAIFKHQSQKDTAVFPGSDEREFWQRAADRARNGLISIIN